MTERPPDDPAAASDHALLARWRRGHDDASTELYLRYADRLRALARTRRGGVLAARFDPEDIVQSVFRTFFRRAAAGLYEVPDGEELWKLLLVIALNKVRAAAVHHTAAKRDVRRTEGGDALLGAGGDDALALTTLRLVIDELLDELTPLHRQVLDLRVSGHEVAEIATLVGRSKRTVERALQQFRDGLHRRLAADVETTE